MPTSDATPWSRRRVLGLGVAALAFVACGSDDDSAGSSDESSAARTDGGSDGVQVVSPARAAEVLDEQGDEVFVLDVRTPEEYADGHLEDAELIDIQQEGFEERIAELDRDRPYVVYCRSGNRSARARELMADLGFEEVYDIDGGIVAWTDAGFPVVS